MKPGERVSGAVLWPRSQKAGLAGPPTYLPSAKARKDAAQYLPQVGWN